MFLSLNHKTGTFRKYSFHPCPCFLFSSYPYKLPILLIFYSFILFENIKKCLSFLFHKSLFTINITPCLAFFRIILGDCSIAVY